ncbi:MAG: recombinase family protein [Oscillospiraceae bacterium]|nr:recombinase family protein [Oscillospiraceae bacterium]
MASQKYTILYGRLSQEDARLGDSNSIINQRLLLEKYAADNGFENAIFLADDGYSGTNFERPSWKKVIEMIEADEVETLIVKDGCVNIELNSESPQKCGFCDVSSVF